MTDVTYTIKPAHNRSKYWVASFFLSLLLLMLVAMTQPLNASFDSISFFIMLPAILVSISLFVLIVLDLMAAWWCIASPVALLSLIAFGGALS